MYLYTQWQFQITCLCTHNGSYKLHVFVHTMAITNCMYLYIHTMAIINYVYLYTHNDNYKLHVFVHSMAIISYVQTIIAIPLGYICIIIIHIASLNTNVNHPHNHVTL